MIHQNVRGRFAKLGAAAVSFALAATLCVPAAGAFAAPSDAKRAEARAALAQLNEMQRKLDQASNFHFEAEQAQKEAEAKRDEAQARMDEASEKIGSLQNRLGTRARSMYTSGVSSLLDLLLGATSFEEFATNWDILEQMNKNDSELVNQTKQLRETIKKSKEEYAEQAKTAKAKADEAKKIEDEAQSTVAAMQRTYDGLSAEAAALLEQEREAERAAAMSQAHEVVRNAGSTPMPAGGGGGNGGGGNGGGGGGYNPPAYVPSTGNAVVDRARAQLGKPYVWGACGMGGFDCSGLVSYAISGSPSRLGTTYTFMGWNRVSDPQPGDICTSSSHCGIYIGGGRMIHAATFGVGVIEGPVQSGMIFVRP